MYRVCQGLPVCQSAVSCHPHAPWAVPCTVWSIHTTQHEMFWCLILPGNRSWFSSTAKHNSAVYTRALISGPNLEMRSPGTGTVLLPLWLPTHPRGAGVSGAACVFTAVSRSGCDSGDQDCVVHCRLQLCCAAHAAPGQREPPLQPLWFRASWQELIPSLSTLSIHQNVLLFNYTRTYIPNVDIFI